MEKPNQPRSQLSEVGSQNGNQSLQQDFQSPVGVVDQEGNVGRAGVVYVHSGDHNHRLVQGPGRLLGGWSGYLVILMAQYGQHRYVAANPGRVGPAWTRQTKRNRSNMRLFPAQYFHNYPIPGDGSGHPHQIPPFSGLRFDPVNCQHPQ